MSAYRLACSTLRALGRRWTLIGIAVAVAAVVAVTASEPARSDPTPVADTLFGRVPFTGQLPQSWPRTLSQEPLNAGQPNYDPLFPFGWGLRTSSPRRGTTPVTAARDLAQARIVRAGGPDARTSPLIADADHALLTGDRHTAIRLLLRAAAIAGHACEHHLPRR